MTEMSPQQITSLRTAMNCANFKRELAKYITIPYFKPETRLPHVSNPVGKVVTRNRFEILAKHPALVENITETDNFKTNRNPNGWNQNSLSIYQTT